MSNPEQGPPTWLVITSFGREVILLVDGDHRRAKVRRQAGKVVCGDRIVAGETAGETTVEQICPRETAFYRADSRGAKRLIAANVDHVVIVVAAAPAPTRDIINRYLVACEALEIRTTIAVNKVDLLDGSGQDLWARRRKDYAELGYDVVETSTKGSPGIEDLRQRLTARTSILVGQSGVGKSSLANALIPDLELKTRDLSDATGKGRHTTTRTTLYPLSENGAEQGAEDEAGDQAEDQAENGWLMDSPGVWEYGLWDMTETEVADGFREFRPFIGSCRFANCSHRHEPACAVRQAAETGQIVENRYESYLRICQQLDSVRNNQSAW